VGLNKKILMISIKMLKFNIRTVHYSGSIPDGVIDIFIDIILPADSASNRNEYQEYFLGVKVVGV
jgi:hypothetical protein